ncbi:MAG: hypothetical protein ACLPVF_10980 [Acidimicrobiales bacterium]
MAWGIITRVAGTGSPGNSGDDGTATAALLSLPQGLAVTADGGFLVADSANHEVRKVSASGIISRVAGTGAQGKGGDDGPATEAQLNGPMGVAVTADGGFLIADTQNNEVRKVSASGIISRVAGTGAGGKGGDDGPATEAQLNSPGGVAVTADGGFLVADTANNEVRKVSASGIITRVAGTGTARNAGDDGPATEAQLNFPRGVAVTADGGFVIVDTLNGEVREVSASGIITRVAGTGQRGYTGDDGPATEAELSDPHAVAVTADGGILIVDNANLVREVSSTGTITTVAGSLHSGNAGDDGSATAALLNLPQGLAVTADGGFLIADSENHEVRKVSPSPSPSPPPPTPTPTPTPTPPT